MRQTPIAPEKVGCLQEDLRTRNGIGEGSVGGAFNTEERAKSAQCVRAKHRPSISCCYKCTAERIGNRRQTVPVHFPLKELVVKVGVERHTMCITDEFKQSRESLLGRYAFMKKKRICNSGQICDKAWQLFVIGDQTTKPTMLHSINIHTQCADLDDAGHMRVKPRSLEVQKDELLGAHLLTTLLCDALRLRSTPSKAVGELQ